MFKQEKRKERKHFFIKVALLLVLFIDGLGISLVLPLFSDLFLIPETAILTVDTPIQSRNMFYTLSLLSFSAAMFLSAPVLGDLSDKFGRKKILILALLGTAVGYLLSGIAIKIVSVKLFLVGRALDGFTAGTIPIAQASMTDISDNDSKMANFGMILFAVTAGYFIGPILSEVLSNTNFVTFFSLATPFYFTAILSILGLALLLPMSDKLAVNDKKINKSAAFNTFKSLRQTTEVKWIMAGLLLFQLAWSMYFQYLPHVMTALGQADSIKFTLATLGLGMTLSFCLFARWLQGGLSQVILVKLSALIIATAILLQIIFYAQALIVSLGAFVAASAYGVGYSAILAYLSSSVSEKLQGLIMGVAASISSFAALMTALVGGILVNSNSKVVYFFAIGSALIIPLCLSRHEKQELVYVE